MARDGEVQPMSRISKPLVSIISYTFHKFRYGESIPRRPQMDLGSTTQIWHFREQYSDGLLMLRMEIRIDNIPMSTNQIVFSYTSVVWYLSCVLFQIHQVSDFDISAHRDLQGATPIRSTYADKMHDSYQRSEGLLQYSILRRRIYAYAWP